MEVTKNCSKHGDYLAKSVSLMGRCISTACPICQQERADNTKQVAQAMSATNRTSKIEKLLNNAAIPPRFKNRSFENFKSDTDDKRYAAGVCRSMAANFDNCLMHGTSFLFCGKPGTGKSHLAAAIASTIIHQGRSAVYTTVLRAIRSIKDTYRKDSDISEQKAINAFIAPDFLIIDEVGVQFGSETEKMYLFEILNGRYEHQKPTVLITNLSPKESAVFLGERVMDRLMEGGGGILVFNWESYRSKVASDPNLPVVNPQPVLWGNTGESARRVI